MKLKSQKGSLFISRIKMTEEAETKSRLYI